MIRHTNSFILSLLVHLLLFSALFFTVDYVVSNSMHKKEEKVCVSLTCLVKHQEVKKAHVPQKTQVKQVIKKKSLKEKVVKEKKKVLVKKVLKEEKRKEIIKEEVTPELEVEELSQPVVDSKPANEPIEKSHVVVTPTHSDIVIKKDVKHSPQKNYVNQHLAKISQLLQENLYYPRRARKRGIQGEVIVKFDLSTQAEVSNIEVISSSSKILSRGAIKTIQNLSMKFPKPEEKLTLSVPIVYKLN